MEKETELQKDEMRPERPGNRIYTRMGAPLNEHKGNNMIAVRCKGWREYN